MKVVLVQFVPLILVFSGYCVQCLPLDKTNKSGNLKTRGNFDYSKLASVINPPNKNDIKSDNSSVTDIKNEEDKSGTNEPQNSNDELTVTENSFKFDADEEQDENEITTENNTEDESESYVKNTSSSEMNLMPRLGDDSKSLIPAENPQKKKPAVVKISYTNPYIPFPALPGSSTDEKTKDESGSFMKNGPIETNLMPKKIGKDLQPPVPVENPEKGNPAVVNTPYMNPYNPFSFPYYPFPDFPRSITDGKFSEKFDSPKEDASSVKTNSVPRIGDSLQPPVLVENLEKGNPAVVNTPYMNPYNTLPFPYYPLPNFSRITTDGKSSEKFDSPKDDASSVKTNSVPRIGDSLQPPVPVENPEKGNPAVVNTPYMNPYNPFSFSYYPFPNFPRSITDGKSSEKFDSPKDDASSVKTNPVPRIGDNLQPPVPVENPEKGNPAVVNTPYMNPYNNLPFPYYPLPNFSRITTDGKSSEKFDSPKDDASSVKTNSVPRIGDSLQPPVPVENSKKEKPVIVDRPLVNPYDPFSYFPFPPFPGSTTGKKPDSLREDASSPVPVENSKKGNPVTVDTPYMNPYDFFPFPYFPFPDFPGRTDAQKFDSPKEDDSSVKTNLMPRMGDGLQTPLPIENSGKEKPITADTSFINPYDHFPFPYYPPPFPFLNPSNITSQTRTDLSAKGAVNFDEDFFKFITEMIEQTNEDGSFNFVKHFNDGSTEKIEGHLDNVGGDTVFVAKGGYTVRLPNGEESSASYVIDNKGCLTWTN